jgi:D-lactate dehydrogenase
MSIKLSIFDVDDKQKKLIIALFEDKKSYKLNFHDISLDINNAKYEGDTEGIAIFIQSNITKGILNHLTNLKVIATMSTGFDHIDLEACEQRNIKVCNVPAYGDNTVAEYAFGLVIALSRKFKPTFNRVERGIFNRSGLMGSDLKGKIIGLIGTGRIGSCMAKLGSAFGMKIIACDPKQDKKLEKEYGVNYTEIENLLQISDVISLHVPYNQTTHHLINSKTIKLLKPTALLINTSRGKVVDTIAIVHALREGRIGGVALDTFEGEEVWIEEEFLRRDDLPAIPLQQAMESFFILRSERAILTPHNAFNTKEALDRILITSTENLKSYFTGNPKNVVT